MELDEKVELGEKLAEKLSEREVDVGEWRRWMRCFAGKRSLEDAKRLAEALGRSTFVRDAVKRNYVGIKTALDEFEERLKMSFSELLEVFGYATRHLTYLEKLRKAKWKPKRTARRRW